MSPNQLSFPFSNDVKISRHYLSNHNEKCGSIIDSHCENLDIFSALARSRLNSIFNLKMTELKCN